MEYENKAAFYRRAAELALTSATARRLFIVAGNTPWLIVPLIMTTRALARTRSRDRYVCPKTSRLSAASQNRAPIVTTTMSNANTTYCGGRRAFRAYSRLYSHLRPLYRERARDDRTQTRGENGRVRGQGEVRLAVKTSISHKTKAGRDV